MSRPKSTCHRLNGVTVNPRLSEPRDQMQMSAAIPVLTPELKELDKKLARTRRRGGLLAGDQGPERAGDSHREVGAS